MPTIASVIGAKGPAGVDAIDLSPVFGGQAVTERPDLYWAYGKEGAPKKTPQPAMEHDRAPPFAVREGDWKLPAGFGGADPAPFTLATAPTESTDATAHAPAVLAPDR